MPQITGRLSAQEAVNNDIFRLAATRAAHQVIPENSPELFLKMNHEKGLESHQRLQLVIYLNSLDAKPPGSLQVEFSPMGSDGADLAMLNGYKCASEVARWLKTRGKHVKLTFSPSLESGTVRVSLASGEPHA